jgi:epsilon-lactone hydrolase
MALSLSPRVVRPLTRLTIGMPGLAHMSPRMERRWLDWMSRIVPLPDGTEIESGELGGVPVTRTTGPWAEEGKRILYIHGGGFTSGSAHTYRGFIAALAQAARAEVHTVDYPLSPEYPYPAAPDACLDAYRALAATDGGPVAVAGDSAGGGLAVGLAIRLRDLGDPAPAGLVLFCPWLDLSHSGESFAACGFHEPVLRPWRSEQNAERYADGLDLDDPRISPLFEEDLAGLPPIHMQGAEFDLLVSDADRFAERVRDAGGRIEYRRFDGLWHDFQVLLEYLEQSRQALGAAAAALEEMWQREPVSVVAGGAVQPAA